MSAPAEGYLIDAGASSPSPLHVAILGAADPDLLGMLASNGLAVVAVAESPDELGSAAEQPDAIVVVADRMSAAERETLGHVRRLFADSALVVVVREAGRRDLRDALDAGADGLVLADRINALAPALRDVCAGQLSVPRELGPHGGPPLLTPREKQILSMVVLGFTNGEIATRLYVAESTVKSHLSSAFAKLGVSSRGEAVAMILDPETGLGTGILAISPPGGPPPDGLLSR